ncbi:hypothetical protein CCR75_000356 [Bremia lactucae]|uniref:NADPH-dependent FMN reductase-like domain-containing protein n=1 Tax=Bremia lactucae TaxID=4779 RepID=A0A976IGA2_BRELC|nr:hypothetical protein CCR75_000356 [Bremia lactucae]
MNSHGIVNRNELRPLRPPRIPVPTASLYTNFRNLNALNSPRNVDALRFRRAAGVLLLIFCLSMAIGLMHVISLSHQMLARLETRHMQQQLYNQPHTQSRGVVGGVLQRVHQDEAANVLIAFSDGPHLQKLAEAVGIGVQSIVGNDTQSLRMRRLENASFIDDVLWADAVILGTHVINANVEPKMTKFMGNWSFAEDLSRKVGAVFVTSGGFSAGEELTMVNLLHSLMIFRMIIVGGEHWTSAFGASAIVGEGPFRPATLKSQDFPSVCYPTDPDSIHNLFKDKAIGLGERVASIATQLRRAYMDLSKRNSLRVNLVRCFSYNLSSLAFARSNVQNVIAALGIPREKAACHPRKSCSTPCSCINLFILDTVLVYLPDCPSAWISDLIVSNGNAAAQ